MGGGLLGYMAPCPAESFLAHGEGGTFQETLEAGLPPVGEERKWGLRPCREPGMGLLHRPGKLLSEETLSDSGGADYRKSTDPGIGRT